MKASREYYSPSPTQHNNKRLQIAMQALCKGNLTSRCTGFMFEKRDHAPLPYQLVPIRSQHLNNFLMLI